MNKIEIAILLGCLAAAMAILRAVEAPPRSARTSTAMAHEIIPGP